MKGSLSFFSPYETLGEGGEVGCPSLCLQKVLCRNNQQQPVSSVVECRVTNVKVAGSIPPQANNYVLLNVFYSPFLLHILHLSSQQKQNMLSRLVSDCVLLLL